MINKKKIYFVVVAVFMILVLSGYGYFALTNITRMNNYDEAVYTLEPGTTLSLDNGWTAFEDEKFEQKVDLTPDVFMTGNYFFKLQLNTSGMKGQNAFLINPVYSAYKMWVNEELIAQVGVPASETESLGLLRAVIIPYLQNQDVLEIVFQVSNNSHTYGGSMDTWLSYGRYEDTSLREHQGKIIDLLIIFGLLSISIVHLFNYNYQRKYSYSMYFSIYLFIYALYVLFTGRMLASYVIPVMNGGFVFRMEEALLILSFPVLMNFIKSLFPDEVHNIGLWIFQTISFAGVILVFALPLEVVRKIVLVCIYINVAAVFYLILCMIKAVKNGKYGAKSTLVSFSLMAVCFLHDFLVTIGVFQDFRLIYVGVFIFAAHQTYRLIMNSLLDYRRSEETHFRLEALTKQKESFFSRNSIELDKPIRNVVELGESLLKGSIGPMNSEQIATSSLIVSNGVRLANMVNDILDFSRIKEKSIELNIVPVDFYKVSRKVLNSCEALVCIQKIELDSEVERDAGLVAVDERRLEQILYNIISNSIRHTKDGRIILSCKENEEVLDIEVAVYGTDLNEKDVEALFNAYEKGVSEGIDDQNVSDLSLAIAKKLIELHKQEIILESSDDKLCYRFSLPIWSGDKFFSEEEALEIDALINLQPVLDEITSDRNIEILIAGKDVEELQIFKSQLSSMNYSVVPMVSGEELLNRIKENVPDLIVSDVSLPDMTGYEVCIRIREDFSKDELPIILVISNEDVSEMMQGLTSGANDFLTRPYLQEEFLTRINTHLQLSRISNIYSRFVPTEFLSALGQKNIVDVKLGDQVSREMTILFVDIRAFTNLSENMTPEENFKFINSYLSRFSPMITNNGGFVDKYIGDAIMALFPNKPEDALAAANEMIAHVNVYNGHRANCGYIPINIGIGIHTGSMILGIIGDEKRMQGTVISDAVNLASRIQDVTKLYKANVVISQETFVKLENPIDYNFRFLGRVKVKGKDKAVALFEIFDADLEDVRDKKNHTKVDFEEAIMKFSRRNFVEAQTLLERVASADPDDQTALVFLDRIEEMRRAEKKAFLTSL